MSLPSGKYDLLRTGRLTRRGRDSQSESKRDESRRLAREFGFHYFDGSRDQGYGGYHYDGRWVPVAKRLIRRYGLSPGSRVIDIGCAKGFLMKDLLDQMPGLEIFGIDVSEYAKSKAPPSIREQITIGCCSRLPFPNKFFDLVISINTIHNLDEAGCIRALKEIVRVSRGSAFVQVDAYRTEKEREILNEWILTARKIDTPHGWQKLFIEAGYTGDYYWTILEDIEDKDQNFPQHKSNGP